MHFCSCAYCRLDTLRRQYCESPYHHLSTGPATKICAAAHNFESRPTLNAVSPTRQPPGFWLNCLVTLIILCRSVQGQQRRQGRLHHLRDTDGAFNCSHLYACLMLQLLDQNRRVRFARPLMIASTMLHLAMPAAAGHRGCHLPGPLRALLADLARTRSEVEHPLVLPASLPSHVERLVRQRPGRNPYESR